MNKLMTLAAIAASATLPMAANADTLYVTNTVGDVHVTPESTVRWLFKIDTSSRMAYPGCNSGTLPNGSWESNTALALDPQVTAIIPRKVTVDGVDYAIDSIAPRAFYQDKTIQNVIAGDHVETVEWRAFHGSTIRSINPVS